MLVGCFDPRPIHPPLLFLLLSPLSTLQHSSIAARRVTGRQRSLAMLPTPGSPSYIPSLLNHINSHDHLQSFSPDPILFSAILLALIVDRGRLIVDLPRTTKVKEKRKVIQHLSAISTAVLGRTTRAISFDATVRPDQVGSLLLDHPEHPADVAADLKSHPQASISQTIIISGLEDLSGPSLLQLNDILVKRSLLVSPTEPARSPKVNLPPGLLLLWVRTAQVAPSPGWWLDHFVSSLALDPGALPAPPPRLATPPNPPIPPSYIDNLHTLLDFTHIHTPLAVHISNLFSATSSHPRLLPTLTGKAIRAFPLFVKAHRLLSAPFPLPPDWELALAVRDSRSGGEMGDKYGVGGGKGGVDTWARLAGEEPPPSVLTLQPVEEVGEDGWFATDENVRGVWNLCIRHRVRLRRPRGDIMWLMRHSAGEPLPVQDETKTRDHDVDTILDDILQRV